MNPGEKITLRDKDYILIRKRHYDPVYIYAAESKDEILRIGPKNIIEQEMQLQKFMISADFPVASILKEGDFDNENYFFTEVFLGDKPFIDLFIEDCRRIGEISDENFKQFLSIIGVYIEAQAKTRREDFESSDIRKIFLIDQVIVEFPELKGKLESYFVSFLDSFKEWPGVLIHADFNAYNIMPRGIIDLDGCAWGPFGFDICVNILHPFGWSRSESEKQVKYRFTENQIREYFDYVDKLAIKLGFPKISPHAAEFYIGRMIFHVADIESFPIIRKLRYDKLNALLDAYLDNADVMGIIKEPM